jgi:transposase
VPFVVGSSLRPGAWRRSLFHGLSQLDLPVVCVESRQAYQALKSVATHKPDRNDTRGLAHLARTGFFKPVHVKSLSARAVRSLIIARKKLVGQRVTLENQIRGLAVVFRLFQSLLTQFSADPGPFGAPQGHVGVQIKVLIDRRRPGVDLRGHRRGSIETFRPGADGPGGFD